MSPDSREPARRATPRLMREAYAFVRDRVWYETLLYPYGRYRHRRAERDAARVATHSYTCFHRSAAQLRALSGPVLDFLTAGDPGRELTVNVFACSTGAEAYTVASHLLTTHPKLKLRVIASDLQDSNIDVAEEARYEAKVVFRSDEITDDFVAATFLREGGDYVVRPGIRGVVSFAQASIVEPLRGDFPEADIVFAQNVLFHLEPDQIERAFANVVEVMKPRSALFIDGMPLDMRVRLTRRFGLVPLNFAVREIHTAARYHVPQPWWDYYYGAEPYSPFVRDRVRRYSTIFLKGA